MIWLFRAFGSLPLWLNHKLGFALGWLAWWVSPRHRRYTRENLSQFAQHTGQTDSAQLRREVIAEQGRSISELAIAWTAAPERLYGLVGECSGWEHVDAARASGRPIILVTPHLGCFEIAGRYLTSRLPVTALYRPPKQKWLEPIMQQGRSRAGATATPANAGGVRTLLRALKGGETVVLLPDQVPGGGDGVWVDFFGKPAYTMTLLPRLALSTNAVVLFFFAERLPRGAGYRVHIMAMPEEFSADRKVAAGQMNSMIEKLIAMAPTQYLWSYNRYKHPAGAPPVDAA